MLIGKRTTRAAPRSRASSVARSSAAASPDSTSCPGELAFDHLAVEAEHREHPAGALIPVLFHQATAFAHQHQGGVEIDDIRGYQRGELPQAVTGHVAGRDHLAHRLPAFAHRIQAGDADGQDRRLGVDRVVQFLLRTLETQPGQRKAEDFVGPSKHAARGFRRVVEGLAHADVLGALSGEYEGHRPIAVWRRRRVGGQATDTFPFT